MRSRARATEASEQRPTNWRRGIARLKMPKPVRPSRLLEALRRAQAGTESPTLPRRQKGRKGP
jgi:hypothetical protein